MDLIAVGGGSGRLRMPLYVTANNLTPELISGWTIFAEIASSFKDSSLDAWYSLGGMMTVSYSYCHN